MYKLFSGLFFAVLFYFLIVVFPQPTSAQSCGGVYYCAGYTRVCRYLDGSPNCIEFSDVCSCSDVPTGSAGEANYCNGIGDAGTCSFVNSYACSETPFGRWSGSCSWTSGGGGGGSCGNGVCGSGESCSNCSPDCGVCTPAASCGCGGGATTQCCDRTLSNGCAAPGICLNSTTCVSGEQYDSSCPVPTPCPYPNGVSGYTTYCSGSTVRESYDRNDTTCGHADNFVANCPNGCANGACIGASPPPSPTTAPCRTVGQSCGQGCCSNLTCNVATSTCVSGGGGGPTATTVPVATATTAPSCGSGGISCTGNGNCPGTMSCISGCCSTGDPGGGCPVGSVDVTDPECNARGVGCCPEWASLCSASTGYMCQAPSPTPTSCKNPGEVCGPAYGNCCGGLYCTSGLCTTPAPTSTPTPNLNLLKGNVFIDKNLDGVKQTGEVNLTGTRMGFNVITTNPSDQNTANYYCVLNYSNSTGIYDFTNQVTDSSCRSYLSRISSIRGDFRQGLSNSTNNHRFTPGGAEYVSKTVSFGGSPNYAANPNPLDFGIAPVVTILGRNLNSAGAQSPPPGAAVSIVGPTQGGSTIQSRATTPWDFTNIWGGTYVITAIKVLGYNVSYMCFGGNCGSTGAGDPDLTTGQWFAGSTVIKTLPNGGDYIDLRFRYTQAPVAQCPPINAGDVDGDGYVTNEDVNLVLRHLGSTYTLTTDEAKRADVDANGTIAFPDASAISGYANGVTTTQFPACIAPTAVTSCTGVQTVSGTIYVDNTGGNCSTSSTPIGANISVTYNRTAKTPTTLTTNTNSSGFYTFTDNPLACTGTRSLTIQPASTYTVTGIKDGASAWQSHTSYTTTLDTLSHAALNWCVSSNAPWYQTGSGDVRFPSLVNRIPAGRYASQDTTNPSVFFSSDDPLTTAFGAGGASSVVGKNWKVGDEYAYNDDFANGLGTMSYTFYNSQKKKKGITNSNISSSYLFTDSVVSGIYSSAGALQLNASALTAAVSDRHIIILAPGNVTITGNITVAPNRGNLFILAAKGNITIDPSVTTLDGYYTAEGNINISHNASADCAPTADVALTVSGGLIANALRPFTVDPTGGKVVNGRTLCAGNATNPSLIVNSRFEFLTQLTDFYKTTNKTYKEVNP